VIGTHLKDWPNAFVSKFSNAFEEIASGSRSCATLLLAASSCCLSNSCSPAREGLGDLLNSSAQEALAPPIGVVGVDGTSTIGTRISTDILAGF
jgi:hypothetical protein